ncbi:hypothetical protein IGX29_25705, partial [Streptomyces sp. H28]|nr:hypothetical protein [Streptomyces sp. H28]
VGTGRRGQHAGKWFFDNTLVGDVVVVKNWPDSAVAPDSGLDGLNSWNTGWGEWVAGRRSEAAPWMCRRNGPLSRKF